MYTLQFPVGLKGRHSPWCRDTSLC